MRAVFGHAYIAPARLANPGTLNAAIEECEPGDAEFYDVFFRGSDGVVEHVESFDSALLAVDEAAEINRHFCSTLAS